MNNKIKFARLIAALFITGLMFIVACDKNNPTCLSLPNSFTYTVNAFDESDTTGGYFGDSVLNFLFTESTTNYTGAGNCPSDKCGIGLKIKNLTPKKMTFNYAVGFVYNNGGSTQNYQGSISIDSLGTYDAGTLSNDCDVVTAPKTTVQLNNISYK